MGKNILIVSSSMSGTQNTKKLCEQFKKGAEESLNHVELIELKGKKINYYFGCNACQKNGDTCIQKDDVSEILEKMIQADVIVLASPVYFYSIAGQMKTLIDRTYAKYNLLSNKAFYFILTCAVPYEEPYKNDLDVEIASLRGFIKCLPNAVEKGVIVGGNMASQKIEETSAYQETYHLGKKI